MEGQFKGLRVLELASVLAGPGVAQFFAELGADVIKVENLKTRGDVTRSWKSAGERTDDRSAYFCSVNWGKRSIAIDLSAPEGREIVHELSRKSQIVIASYKPGDAERLTVDYATLSRQHPGLIYGQITGYGSDNQRVGYDAIIQAEAGFMSMNGLPGGPSLKMPVALIDVLAGHHLKQGLLLAMLEKASTGKGRLVEVSLIQAALSSLANQASNWLVANKMPQKQGSAHPNIAPYGDVFKTADDFEILLAVGTDEQFRNLCKVLEMLPLVGDPRFFTNVFRVENRLVLNDVLASKLRTLSAREALARMHQVKIPAGLIQSVQEALEMPEARGMFLEWGGFRGIKTYSGSNGADVSHIQPPPHFGEHSKQILNEFLNYSPERVENLSRNQIIA
jgi:crotonobetainyl-CoA:carnitine CoA-transferase CaiB-like acyl-CoA transferase